MTFNDAIKNCHTFNELKDLFTPGGKIGPAIGVLGGYFVTCQDYTDRVPLDLILEKFESIKIENNPSSLTSAADAKNECNDARFVFNRCQDLKKQGNLLLSKKWQIISFFSKITEIFYRYFYHVTFDSDQMSASLDTTYQSLRQKHLEFEYAAANEKMPQSLTVDPFSQILRSFDHPTMSGEIVGVYVTANEAGQHSTAQCFQAEPLKQNAVHIGFSSWHNFDIAFQRNSAYVLIADYNPANALFLQYTLLALKQTNTRKEFIQAMLKTVDETSIRFSVNVSYDEDNLMDIDDEIRHEICREGSWLSTDAGFRKIKKLAEEDKVVVLTNDIRNTSDFYQIASLISSKGLEIDTLYLSNISAYMYTDKDRKAYQETIDSLADANTFVISCPSGTLTQHVHRGKDG